MEEKVADVWWLRQTQARTDTPPVLAPQVVFFKFSRGWEPVSSPKRDIVLALPFASSKVPGRRPRLAVSGMGQPTTDMPGHR